jgi:Na+-driven multidrug efflux pump
MMMCSESTSFGLHASRPLLSFLYSIILFSVTATLVSKKHANGDKEGTQDAVCQALFVGFIIAMFGTGLMFFYPDKALSSVLPGGAPALVYAKPYLLIRAFAFLPSMISLIGFSAFRGKGSWNGSNRLAIKPFVA